MAKKVIPTNQIFEYDKSYNAQFVCGSDEAGRGPLAGPVVCASVIMPLDEPIYGIYDSKKISEKMRDELFDVIKEKAIAYHISIVDHKKIDEINILQATMCGLEETILSLKVNPDVILVDAVKNLNIKRDYRAIIKGDQTSYAIASASILAKVTRDKIMSEYAVLYPEYGFEKHKGYGTKAHIDAYYKHGKSPIHRDSFLSKIDARKPD